VLFNEAADPLFQDQRPAQGRAFLSIMMTVVPLSAIDKLVSLAHHGLTLNGTSFNFQGSVCIPWQVAGKAAWGKAPQRRGRQRQQLGA
jgi:hypothetical protein